MNKEKSLLLFNLAFFSASFMMDIGLLRKDSFRRSAIVGDCKASFSKETLVLNPLVVVPKKININ